MCNRVCNPPKKNILKSIYQRYNNLKLTRIFNGPSDIDRTTQSATMGGPLDHPWFLLILHTVKEMFSNYHPYTEQLPQWWSSSTYQQQKLVWTTTVIQLAV